ncbi:MAG: translation initiation factor IF-2 [Phycisphaerales bacterium]|nr:translation initiation factor IF-2 [Phycisphaerales bacterium]
MAKKTASIRVHQVAKDLGVTSKAVVAKCKEEGIPDITNHMSALSAGLAATIRDWFSDAQAGSTSVETAAKVDLKKVKAKPRKKAAKATAVKATAVKAATPAAPEAPPAVQPVEPGDALKAQAKAEPPVAPAADTTEFITSEGPDSDASNEAPPSQAVSMPNEPSRPADIKPIGRKLDEPKKTKLSGPRIIRVEQPEAVPPPRARGPRTGPGRPSGGPGPRPGQGPGPGPGMPGPMDPAGRDAGRSSRGGRNNRRRGGAAERGGAREGRQQQDQQRQSNWREQDLREREMRLNRSGGFFRAVRRDSTKRATSGGGQRAQTALDKGGAIQLAEPISIKALSAESGVKTRDILGWMMSNGHMYTINSDVPNEVAVECMLNFSIELEVVAHETAEEKLEKAFADRDMHDEQPRSPVVTILGHVDHGKTSLLDQIRSANVADGEAGGITQATSAFRVPLTVGDEDRVISFIDTPGHEAFTEMRARGAQVTDIVVLVVAADDGVMPQTVESIAHAKAAGVPIVVALNKIDKPEATDANIQRILGQLAEQELNPVEWGGDIEVVRTSAIKGEGIQDLLEIIDLQSQLLELTADFGGPAEGTVLEARLEEGRGAVASVLVQQGQLKKGAYIVVGRGYGRVRDIVDDRGNRDASAGPSQPVAISGINEVPDAGDRFFTVKNQREAEAAAKERVQAEREKSLTRDKVTLDNILEHMAEAGKKELPVILKCDVQGSVETIRASLDRMSTDEVNVVVKHSAVGGISASDVTLAEASGAVIIGFNATASGSVRKAAERAGVDIRDYDVIYDITEDIEKAIQGLLDPEHRIEVLGHAEVREVFRVSKVGMVAGCYVTDGTIERNALIRVTREDIVVENDRRLAQLKRFKDDAKEVRSGLECGMLIDGYDDIHVGDVLECYRTQEVRPGS